MTTIMKTSIIMKTSAIMIMKSLTRMTMIMNVPMKMMDIIINVDKYAYKYENDVSDDVDDK